jgi:class 3 adenylate cyclase
MIGEARRLKLCVLFLDICRFSQIESGEDADQDSVLKLLNLFMAEMLHVLRASGGYFEKNTGDGLMAYFGEGTQSERTLRAVEAAVTMHHFNDHVISPRLKRLGLTEVRFRVGIETGLVTVANVGVRGDHHSLVAIGNTANVACKLMTLLPNGGIVMGHAARELLPYNWKGQTTELGGLPGFVFKGTGNPYTAWELKYRAPAPAPVLVDWASALTSLAGR